MNLKPIKQMTDDERRAEVEQRLRIGVKESHDVVTIMLLHLRAANIGDDRIAPPEPEWRRKRDPKVELPVDLSRIEFGLNRFDNEVFSGRYIEGRIARFVTINMSYHCPEWWRYLEEPRRWVCIAEEGNPEEYDEPFHVRYKCGAVGIGTLAPKGFWCSRTGVPIDVTHWQRIAPPTPFEEANP